VKIAQTHARTSSGGITPRSAVIEGLFYAQNLQTALTMGEASGAALTAIGEAGLEITKSRRARCEAGDCGIRCGQQKLAVAKWCSGCSTCPNRPHPMPADALALALTHAQENGRYSLTPRKRI